MMCKLHVLCNDEMRTNTRMFTFLTLDSSISKMAECFHFTLEPYGIKLKGTISAFEGKIRSCINYYIGTVYMRKNYVICF